jgi:hypothetical protein
MVDDSKSPSPDKLENSPPEGESLLSQYIPVGIKETHPQVVSSLACLEKETWNHRPLWAYLYPKQSVQRVHTPTMVDDSKSPSPDKLENSPPEAAVSWPWASEF